MNREALYNASLNELLNFFGYCVSQGISRPYLVGGWAVYAFTEKAKSVDIDLVFREKKRVRGLLKNYYSGHGFQREDWGDRQEHWAKPIKVAGEGAGFIRFDWFSFRDENRLWEDPGIKVPWKLLEGFHAVKKIEGQDIKVPCIELLLLFKALAFLDRRAALEARGIRIPPERRAWMKTKIGKDRQDITDLLNTGQVKETVLDTLLKQTGFREKFNGLLEEIGLR